MNSELALIGLRQGGVFTGRQASATGVSRQARRTLIKQGVLRELRRDVFTTGDYWDVSDERERHRLEIAGALVARNCPLAPGEEPRLAAGHASAGFLHGLPLPGEPREADRLRTPDDQLLPWERRPSRVHLISADRERRTYRAGVEIRPASLTVNDVVIDGAVPISSLARTAVDLMRDGTFEEAVAVADVALRLGAERSDLAETAERCRRWPNGASARGAVLFADGRAESPAESLCRLRLAEAGYVPELQVDLYDAVGHIARVDLFLRAFRIVVEVDGLVKILDPWAGSAEEELRRREVRERRLRDAGWIVIRTTWHELMYDKQGFIARIEAAIVCPAAQTGRR